jgi:hypothetical protein
MKTIGLIHKHIGSPLAASHVYHPGTKRIYRTDEPAFDSRSTSVIRPHEAGYTLDHTNESGSHEIHKFGPGDHAAIAKKSVELAHKELY